MPDPTYPQPNPLTSAIVATVRRTIPAFNEWFGAVHIGQHSEILAVQPLAVNHTCPIPDEQIYPEAVFAEASRLRARSLVTVRYHPHEGPCLTSRSLAYARRFYAASLTSSVLYYDHLILYLAAMPLSFRALSRLGLWCACTLAGADKLVSEFDDLF